MRTCSALADDHVSFTEALLEILLKIRDLVRLGLWSENGADCSFAIEISSSDSFERDADRIQYADSSLDDLSFVVSECPF